MTSPNQAVPFFDGRVAFLSATVAHVVYHWLDRESIDVAIPQFHSTPPRKYKVTLPNWCRCHHLLVHDDVCTGDCLAWQRPHQMHLCHCSDIVVTSKAVDGFWQPPKNIGGMLAYHSEMQLLIGEHEQVVHLEIRGFCLMLHHQLTGLPHPSALHVIPCHHPNCLFHLPLARSAPISS